MKSSPILAPFAGFILLFLAASFAHADTASTVYYSPAGAIVTGTLQPATYLIHAYGGDGGTSILGDGGNGATATGEFTFATTSTLSILVGSQPTFGGDPYRPAGGGGATFLFLGNSTTAPLLVAGGGGGSGGVIVNGTTTVSTNGIPGQPASAGADAQGGGSLGGTDGNGGAAGSSFAGGGAGVLTDGSGQGGGQTYADGGGGGEGYNSTNNPQYSNAAAGGFGGGGGGSVVVNGNTVYLDGGGGGGYSGGAGGDDGFGGGGGGGSYVSPSAAFGSTGFGPGHGDGELDITPLGVIANVVQGDVLVTSTDAVPQMPNAKYVSIGSPAYVGETSFAAKARFSGRGITGANNTGIVEFSLAGGFVAARTGANALDPSYTPLPSVYATLSDPGAISIVNGSALTWIGTLKGGGVSKSDDTGIWNYAGLFYVTGTSDPLMPGVYYSAFNQVVAQPTSGAAFVAKLSGTAVKPSTNLALCAPDLSGTQSVVVRTGESVTLGSSTRTVSSFGVFGTSAGVAAQGRGIDSQGNLYVFNVGYTDHTAGIVLASGTTPGFALQGIADTTGTGVPGDPVAKFSTLYSPVVNASGEVAFRARLASTSKTVKITGANDTGIWLDSGTATSLVARTGSGTAPGASAVFASLGDPVLNDNGSVAFQAKLATGKSGVPGADAAGIWADVSGTLSLVAQAGGSAPIFSGSVAATGTFASFNQMVLPDNGGPIFTANLAKAKAGANTGIWSVDGAGMLHLVAQAGNTVLVHGTAKTIKTLSAFTAAPRVAGQDRNFDAASRTVIYQANFTDGTWALLKSIAP